VISGSVLLFTVIASERYVNGRNSRERDEYHHGPDEHEVDSGVPDQ
jgi:hypothetical protein